MSRRAEPRNDPDEMVRAVAINHPDRASIKRNWLWFSDQEVEASFQALHTSRRLNVWLCLPIIFGVGTASEGVERLHKYGYIPDNSMLVPGHLTLLTGLVLLAIGVAVGATYSQTRKAHRRWQVMNEIGWAVIGFRQAVVVMKKFHGSAEPPLEDLLMGCIFLMLSPFFMAWTQANKITTAMLTLISLLVILTSPHASLILQIRLCTIFSIAVLGAVMIYTNNMQHFTNKLQMNWLSERQAMQRERLVEHKLELQLQAHAHLVASTDASLITQATEQAVTELLLLLPTGITGIELPCVLDERQQLLCQLQRTIQTVEADTTNLQHSTRLHALKQASKLLQCSSFLLERPLDEPVDSSASAAGAGTGTGIIQMHGANQGPPAMTHQLSWPESQVMPGSVIMPEGNENLLDAPYGALDGLFGATWDDDSMSEVHHGSEEVQPHLLQTEDQLPDNCPSGAQQTIGHTGPPQLTPKPDGAALNLNWGQVFPDSSSTGLLGQHAKELVSLSFDAMAVMVAGVKLWSNPAFELLAGTLGDGDTHHGMNILHDHFHQSGLAAPSVGVQFSMQEILGVSSTWPSKCITKCLADSPQQFLWILSNVTKSKPPKLKVSDPKLSDPAIRVLIPDNCAKRKRDDGGEVQKELNLWQKYGSKVVANSQTANCKVMVKRCYYKCFVKDCLARLHLDSDKDTGAHLKTTAIGIHNHEVVLASEPLDDSSSEALDSRSCEDRMFKLNQPTAAVHGQPLVLPIGATQTRVCSDHTMDLSTSGSACALQPVTTQPPGNCHADRFNIRVQLVQTDEVNIHSNSSNELPVYSTHPPI